VKHPSNRQLRWVIAGLCALAAVRVFVFAAAFPFFNNVDEQAHVDLVVKYAHGNPPRGLEPFSADAAGYFAIYSTPEYFVPPSGYGGQYPPPRWLLAPEEQQHMLHQESAFWEQRVNHESGEPPLYYGAAGVWFDLGRAFGLRGLVLLYWVRFLNVAFAGVLVWLGYAAAKIIFPDRQFLAIATAALLAVWPQSSFYSIQGDSLSAVAFAITFIGLVKLWQSEQPNIRVAGWIGLAIAATCLVKTANLPLIFVVALAVIFKTFALARAPQRQRALSIFAAFLICAVVPIGIWFAWNQNRFGDLTATKLKIQLLDWTPKAFADWWSHPIFTPRGAKDFWAELIASFWRGEFIWHGERMATWWSDAFYWTSSTIAVAITIWSLITRRRSEGSRAFVWLALLSFGALVGFLVLLSIRYDFGQCPYPSRAHPFFTSGRLLNAAAVPFFLLFARAIEQVAAWTRRDWPRWFALAVVIIAICGWQLSIDAPAFSSRYNFFHRSKVQ
jgi:Predicted membrane protein (DUF2142)